MSVETGAPGAGGEAIVGEPTSVVTLAPETPKELSVSDAARALRAARKPKETPVPMPAAEAPPEPKELAQANADPVEPAPSEETPETDPAEPLPPIDPPRSWTKEEKVEFAAYPREAQEKIARREQERETALRRSQNETAEERKAAQAERTQAEQARKEFEAKLPALMQALQDAQAGQFADIKNMDDVSRLATEDPLRYLQWQAHQQKLQAVAYEESEAKKRTEHEAQSKWAKHVQDENRAFAEKAPEFADKDKAKELTQKAVEKLQDIGFSDQELADYASGKERLSIYDHRVQLLILDSLKYADVQKAKTTIAAKPVPPVQRPGVAKPQGASNAQTIKDLETKLETATGLNAIRIARDLTQARRASAR